MSESIKGYGEIVVVLVFVGLDFLILLGQVSLYQSLPCSDDILASKGYDLPPFLMNGHLNAKLLLYTYFLVSRLR